MRIQSEIGSNLLAFSLVYVLCILINLLKEASLSSTFLEDQKVIFFASFFSFGFSLRVASLYFNTYLKIKNYGKSYFYLLLCVYLQFDFIIKYIIFMLKATIGFCKLYFMCPSIKDNDVSFLIIVIQILEVYVKKNLIENPSLLSGKHL